MTETTTVPNIFQRLNAVMKEVNYVKKDKRVDGAGGGYKAVTHNMVTAITRNEFVDHGIVIVPEEVSSCTVETGRKTAAGNPIIRFEGRYAVHFVNMDDPTDRTTVTFTAHADDFGDKAPGKAHSYAVKYAVMKVLQLESGEDDESRVQDAAPVGEQEEKKTIKSPEKKSDKSQPAANEPDAATPASGKGDMPQERADAEKCSAGTAKMIKSYVELKGPKALAHVKQALVNLNIDKFSDMPKAEAKLLLDHLKTMPDGSDPA
jgi:ERF superfamily